MRTLIPVLIVLIGIAGLCSQFAITSPRLTIVTRMSPVILTAEAPEILLDYSTSTITCTGTVPVCFMQVYPYTYTETWSAQTTPIIPFTSTSTAYVVYAMSGPGGDFSLLLLLLFLIGGIILLTKDFKRQRNVP